jgi:hypothetical protein
LKIFPKIKKFVKRGRLIDFCALLYPSICPTCMLNIPPQNKKCVEPPKGLLKYCGKG